MLNVKSRVLRSDWAMRASWFAATLSSEASERRSTSCWQSYATSRHSSYSPMNARYTRSMRPRVAESMNMRLTTLAKL